MFINAHVSAVRIIRSNKLIKLIEFEIIAASLIGLFGSLLISQMIMFHIFDEQLSRQSVRLLEGAVDVARQSREKLGAINTLATDQCSPADLSEMRYILHSASNLEDVGRARNGRIICTAIWGVLSEPISLPPPDWKTESNESLWKDVRSVPDSRLTADIGIYKSAVTYIRANIFERYAPMDPSMQATLVSRDRAHIFQLFGRGSEDLVEDLGRPNDYFALRGRHQSICDRSFLICAVVRDNESASIWEQAPGMATLVLLLGAFAGAGGGHALRSFKRSKRTLQKQLQRALRRGDVRAAYQPIVALSGGSIVGVEVLARWNDENGRAVPPETFVPIIEDLGLSSVLTRKITVKALGEVAPYLQRNPQLYVSINVTAADITSEDFQNFIYEQTKRNGLKQRQIALEITERQSTFMTDLTDAVATLRMRGYRVFIDDFGTGYSGIAYLANMQVDAIKIDRMFSSAIGTDSVHARMLEKICSMVSDVGGAIIVEGVETEIQAAMLRAAYPEATAQGWFFGMPSEGVDAFSALLPQ